MKDLLIFGFQQARSCLFAASFFMLLVTTHILPLPIPRPDALFIGATLIQLFMVITRLESPRELFFIFCFHIIGLGLEFFKSHPQIGAWSYGDPGNFHIAHVPLYSGFMYAAVGSYMLQAWKHLSLRVDHFPPLPRVAVLALAIYLNFFTNRFVTDLRWVILPVALILFSRTRVRYSVNNREREMPLPLSFFLIAFFIYLAENFCTFFGAWRYGGEHSTWSPVSLHIIGSWTLLVILSFTLAFMNAREKVTHEK
jgi:uncharacterized membrane protein YoaT (DUF817 family)